MLQKLLAALTITCMTAGAAEPTVNTEKFLRKHLWVIETRQVPELRMSPELRAKLDAVLGPVPEAPVRQLPVPEKSLGLDL